MGPHKDRGIRVTQWRRRRRQGSVAREAAGQLASELWECPDHTDRERRTAASIWRTGGRRGVERRDRTYCRRAPARSAGRYLERAGCQAGSELAGLEPQHPNAGGHSGWSGRGSSGASGPIPLGSMRRVVRSASTGPSARPTPAARCRSPLTRARAAKSRWRRTAVHAPRPERLAALGSGFMNRDAERTYGSRSSTAAWRSRQARPKGVGAWAGWRSWTAPRPRRLAVRRLP
jgi:hypothetical protein